MNILVISSSMHQVYDYKVIGCFMLVTSSKRIGSCSSFVLILFFSGIPIHWCHVTYLYYCICDVSICMGLYEPALIAF